MKLAMLEAAKAYDSGVGLGKAPEGDATFPAKQRLAKINVHVHVYASYIAKGMACTHYQGLTDSYA